MAEKTSFVLHTAHAAPVRKLADEDAGQLLKGLFVYVETGTLPKLSPLADMAFAFIRERLDADAARYTQTCQRRAEAGKKGGRPRKQEEANESKKSNSFSEKQKNPDTDADTDSDAEYPTGILSPQAPQGAAVSQIIQHLNVKTGAKFSSTSKATIRLIGARLSEGYAVQDFITVIDRQCAAWLSDARMCQYLRPSTLFAPSKFEGYLHGVASLAPAQGEQKPEGRVLQRWD